MMELSERKFLLEKLPEKRNCSNKLSLTFAIICIVDVFGVFPVITLPKTIIDCGIYGIMILGLVCLVQIYTAILLGKCWMMAEEMNTGLQKKNRYPYSALAEITFGAGLSNFVSFLLDVTVFGGGIPNLIVASQNLQLLGLRLSNFDMSFCYWIIVIGVILCPILWLGSPKDMKLLCSISVSVVIVVFLLVTGCLIFSPKSEKALASFNSQRPFWELFFITYGIISFQYDIHPSILTIQVDMENKSNVPLAILGGFGVSLGMFSIIATIAAIKFGSSVQASILETLPTTVPLHFAAFFVAVQLCLSSAVSNNALYQHIEDCMSISRIFNHRRCVLRTTLTLFAVLIAESVPRFDLVMSLIGGTLTGPLVFILPPLFYLRLLVLQKKHEKQLAMESFANVVSTTREIITSSANNYESQVASIFCKKTEIVLCVFILICSTVCTIASTYVNIKDAITFANFSQPCIVNVSTVLINL